MLLVLKILFFFLGGMQQPDGGASCQSLLISYEVRVQSKNRNKSTAELYNGSSKLLAIRPDTIEVRLTSLLRNEKVWILRKGSGYTGKILKDSSGSKRSYGITMEEWKGSFQPWVQAKLEEGGAEEKIAGYNCRRAVLKGADNQVLVVYYTDRLHHKAYKIAEPMFSSVPGVVLKYEFRSRESVITYTASKVVVR